MQIKTFAEQLFFVTVRLEAQMASERTCGTGFIYSVPVQGAGSIQFLVTNRHILESATTALVVRTLAATGPYEPDYGTPTQATVDLSDVPWYAHPDPAVDVAVVPFDPIRTAMAEHEKPPFVIGVPAEIAMTANSASQLDAIEDILFVGYPHNLFDAHNLTPVARRGTTATPVMLDYNAEPAFLIDAAVFPGSSGSPVFILSRGYIIPRDGPVRFGRRLILLGVIAAMEARNVQADLVQIKTQHLGLSFQDPLNLGIVFKAAAIEACVNAAFESFGISRGPSRFAVEAEEEAEQAA